MDKITDTMSKDSNNDRARFFARNGSIFRGGSRTPVPAAKSTLTSPRPSTGTSTSGDSTKTSDHITPLISSAASINTAPSSVSSGTSERQGLFRKASSSFLKQPKTRIRTSSFGAQFIVPHHKLGSVESVATVSERKRGAIPIFHSHHNNRKSSISEEQEYHLSQVTSNESIVSPTSGPQVVVDPAIPASWALSPPSSPPSDAVFPLPATRNDEQGRMNIDMFYHSSMAMDFSTRDAKPRSGSTAGLSLHNSRTNTEPINSPPSPSIEALTYAHINEMSQKRIATLDYLRKAHEGRTYWFNTLLFPRHSISTLLSFEQRKLARRATNYLLLGVSLPTILDLNSSNAIEFLRSLNALLAEFESYTTLHPIDGTQSSLSRARIPQMFKRAASSTAKGRRRDSTAADHGQHNIADSDLKNLIASGAGIISHSHPGFGNSFNSSDELLPGEEYSLLLTPSLPFEPDFYEVFATLCDVLIDCYTKLLGLVEEDRKRNKEGGGGNGANGAQVAELFGKADGRVRKIVVQGVVKEFEEEARKRGREEVGGVGRVVLGGLM